MLSRLRYFFMHQFTRVNPNPNKGENRAGGGHGVTLVSRCRSRAAAAAGLTHTDHHRESSSVWPTKRGEGEGE